MHHTHNGNKFIESDILQGLQIKDKAAILMVHFGTTYDETRSATIDATNNKVKEAFTEFEIREAYTSRIVIRRLSAKGIQKDTPIDALLKLKTEEYTHILIQSTHMIDGVEMESLRNDVKVAASFFKEIRVGTPILYSTSDFKKVADLLEKKYKQPKAIVFVGHGSNTPSTASYTMLDYIFKDKGLANFHVGTIEGYPSYNETVKQLKRGKERKVLLVPLMFVAGNHATNDISTDWKNALEEEGFSVEVHMKGLGESLGFQNLFVDKLNFMRFHTSLTSTEKKKMHTRGKDSN